jgi:hypothetical protein
LKNPGFTTPAVSKERLGPVEELLLPLTDLDGMELIRLGEFSDSPGLLGGLQRDLGFEGGRMSFSGSGHDAPRDGWVIFDQCNIPTCPVSGVHLTPTGEKKEVWDWRTIRLLAKRESLFGRSGVLDGRPVVMLWGDPPGWEEMLVVVLGHQEIMLTGEAIVVVGNTRQYCGEGFSADRPTVNSILAEDGTRVEDDRRLPGEDLGVVVQRIPKVGDRDAPERKTRTPEPPSSVLLNVRATSRGTRSSHPFAKHCDKTVNRMGSSPRSPDFRSVRQIPGWP